MITIPLKFLEVEKLLNEELRKQDYYEHWMKITVSVAKGSEHSPKPSFDFSTSETNIEPPTEQLVLQYQRISKLLDLLQDKLSELLE